MNEDTLNQPHDNLPPNLLSDKRQTEVFIAAVTSEVNKEIRARENRRIATALFLLTVIGGLRVLKVPGLITKEIVNQATQQIAKMESRIEDNIQTVHLPRLTGDLARISESQIEESEKKLTADLTLLSTATADSAARSAAGEIIQTARREILLEPRIELLSNLISTIQARGSYQISELREIVNVGPKPWRPAGVRWSG